MRANRFEKKWFLRTLLIFPAVLFVASVCLSRSAIAIPYIISIHIIICATLEIARKRFDQVHSVADQQDALYFFGSVVIAAIICVIALMYGYMNRDIDARGIVFSVISSAWITNIMSRSI